MSSELIPNDQQLSEQFTFIQLNFWGGRLYYPICKFLERETPDIFSAQEMLSGPHSSKPDVMTAEMMLTLDVNYFADCAMGAFRSKMINAYGLERQDCIATFACDGFKIKSKNIVPIVTEDKPDHFGRVTNKDYYSLLHTQIEMQSGELIHIVNYHGRVIIRPNSRLGTPECDEDFQRVADYVATLSGPIILSGDFNLAKEATSFAPLKALGLRNLNDIYKIDAGRNEFSWKPDEVVSHIFINDKVVIEDYYVPTDNVSDHLPLVLKCRVQK